MLPDEVAIPARMRGLPLDRRGYPIPATVLIDDNGRPHFTINDEVKRQALIKRDACPICGQRIIGGRWFVGGPLSAFHEHGTYIDPPMHDECAHYALQVCPYLAAPVYSGRIDTRTLGPGHEHLLMMMDPTMIADRPALFVAVLCRTNAVTRDMRYLRPNRPYMRVEYWRHGERVDDAEGAAIVAEVLGQPVAPKGQPRIIVR
jgi:hypothetical protein